jgi:hypothetical protein
MNPTLTKTYVAEAAVTKRRIVKPGTADGNVLLGAAVGDALIGVSADIDAAIGERVDVHHAGIVEVEYGGTVARGDPLTSDGTGRAVAAAPGAGVNNNIIGRALVAGVVGDIGKALIAPGRIQG